MSLSKKIVLLGHFGVGKSSLIRRFVEDTFTDNYKVTIGVHILKKEVEVTDKTIVNLIIWDLEGNDDIANTRPSYMLGTNGIIYVYDLTRPTTYQDLKKDLDFIKTNYANIPIKVVGNKKDLVTNVFLKENEDAFQPYTDFFTSAKKNTKVDKMFSTLAKDLIL
ncbi:Rab family GTPase [Oceanihabitans sediminis]|uniref:GTP-binding protein n=1 Tax=Oceanihabitans sediminis TaxID=1812012 RepID=A0A368P6L2_9FLAO|nr:Rab family GTPase [Oceanihabitans sediminis]MDX1277479.1 Rab family GTPase [Oceanihabitans sediminis]RBP34498.1 small GTP-binding protein [Oceanihabitans sediminis]RCU58168.1 GTP-binding protein [Oceanihabitans sediminis]